MIKSIKITNFRNYSNFNLSFTPNLNLIVGDNGLGKTNLLESIYTLLLTKSIKSLKENNLIKHGENYFRIEGIFDQNKLSFYFDNKGKKVFKDSAQILKISDYIKDYKIIYYGPDEIYVIKGSPRERRKYLDQQLSQFDEGYIQTLILYNKILKQKNAYLKQLNIEKDVIYSYNEQLCKPLKYLTESRLRYLNLINKTINKYWSQYYGGVELKIVYKTKIKTVNTSELIKQLNYQVESEIRQKSTQVGIHLDDFAVLFNGEEAANVASEGQIKLIILSLKQSDIEIMANNNPKNRLIILFDDLFSELDIKNSNKLVKSIKNNCQIIITTTDTNKINDDNLINANVIKIAEMRKKDDK